MKTKEEVFGEIATLEEGAKILERKLDFATADQMKRDARMIEFRYFGASNAPFKNIQTN